MPNIIHEGITNLDVSKINFEDKDAVRELILRLLNTVEQLAQSNQELRKENQQLKDEINRLKGEKANPKYGRTILNIKPTRRRKRPKDGIKRSRNQKSKSIGQNTSKLISRFFHLMQSIMVIDRS